MNSSQPHPLTRTSILIVGYCNVDFGKQDGSQELFSTSSYLFHLSRNFFKSPSCTNQFSILVHNYLRILILLDLSIWNLYCMIFVNMPQFEPLFKIVGNVSLFYNRNFTKCELYIPGVKDFFSNLEICRLLFVWMCIYLGFFTSKNKSWRMH